MLCWKERRPLEQPVYKYKLLHAWGIPVLQQKQQGVVFQCFSTNGAFSQASLTLHFPSFQVTLNATEISSALSSFPLQACQVGCQAPSSSAATGPAPGSLVPTQTPFLPPSAYWPYRPQLLLPWKSPAGHLTLLTYGFLYIQWLKTSSDLQLKC